MTTLNAYATLAGFKSFMTPRSQTATTDATDDVNIELILNGVSRWFDGKTGRTFYPRVETHLFDLPTPYRNEVILDDDLLEVTTLLNGDGTAITSADYLLYPYNETPKCKLGIKRSSNITWNAAADGNQQGAVSLLGVWGYREKYSTRGWVSGGTLGAAITDTTTLAFTMTAGHTLAVGQIVKIDSELYNIATVSTNTITPVQRGDNGSTAATHLNGATVYVWQVMDEVKEAVLDISQSLYQSRSGQNSQGKVTITAAGVVVQPQDISETSARTIMKLTRTV